MKATVSVIAAVFGVVALLFIATERRPTPGMSEAEAAQVRAEVRELAEAWINAWNDVETACETTAGLWHPDHGMFFSGGERISGQAWIDYCNRTTANRASVDGTWTNSEVRVLSPDAAVFLGSYESTMGYLDGSPTLHWPTANQAILVERTATGWGISFFTNFNGPSEVVEEG